MQVKPAGTSSSTKALLKHPTRLELIQRHTKLKAKTQTTLIRLQRLLFCFLKDATLNYVSTDCNFQYKCIKSFCTLNTGSKLNGSLQFEPNWLNGVSQDQICGLCQRTQPSVPSVLSAGTNRSLRFGELKKTLLIVCCSCQL